MDKQIYKLGQSVIRYVTPPHIMDKLNKIYNKRKKNKLKSAAPFLVGKIKNEYTLYNDQLEDESTCNHLDHEVLNWFMQHFKDYVDTLTHKYPNAYVSSGRVALKLSSMWINEMKAGEYNPVHHHFSARSIVGLSSVMFLKIPKNYGKEIASKQYPTNGRLEFIGNTNGQFVFPNFIPEVKEGDFFIFPYDLQHVVYPFKDSKEARRTLSANVDVFKHIENNE
jgi:hypothetical protein